MSVTNISENFEAKTLAEPWTLTDLERFVMRWRTCSVSELTRQAGDNGFFRVRTPQVANAVIALAEEGYLAPQAKPLESLYPLQCGWSLTELGRALRRMTPSWHLRVSEPQWRALKREARKACARPRLRARRRMLTTILSAVIGTEMLRYYDDGASGVTVTRVAAMAWGVCAEGGFPPGLDAIGGRGGATRFPGVSALRARWALPRSSSGSGERLGGGFGRAIGHGFGSRESANCLFPPSACVISSTWRG
jgi:hypothetical protein